MSMLLASWNVNGLRACMNKGFMDFFNQGFDIVCLQEIKMQRNQAEFKFNGYHEYWNSADQKGYSGTAVFSRQPALSASYGMGRPEHDTEGRVITLQYDAFYLVNVYTPNSKEQLLRLDYRMEWDDAFRAYLCGLDAKKPVVVCGDLNCAHNEIDLAYPKTNENSAGFTQKEREKLSKLLLAGFTDTFRYLYPDKRDAYTWWSYQRNSRLTNAGWRIDYFLVSDALKDNINKADIYDKVYGSDHCPIGLGIDIPPLANG